MIKFDQQEMQVSGKIDYSNAEQYYQKGLNVIQAQSQFPVVVNLSQLEQAGTGQYAGFGGIGALAASDAGCAWAAV